MKKRFSESSVYMPLLAGLVLFGLASAASAQTIEEVTNNNGDQSVGSLGGAVIALNAAGDGSITVDDGIGSIALTQALAPVSVNVNLLNDPSSLIQVIGQGETQSQMFFQQTFNQNANLIFQNGGTGAGQLDASVTAFSWIVNSPNYVNVLGGNASAVTGTGGSALIGMDGGSVSATVGFWTASGIVVFNAGSGGSVTDSGGIGDLGGAGGSAFLTGSSLTAGSNFQVQGGFGGSVTDSGGGSNTGGTGGSASVSFNDISLGVGAQMEVTAGHGGAGVTGGTGGAATAISNVVFSSQNLYVLGGDGGAGSTVSGNGGDADVSFGSYTTYAGSQTRVQGGMGGTGLATAGDGGNALYLGGSATINCNYFKVIGGAGGNSGTFPSGPGNGGNGGNASVSLGTLLIGSGSLSITGGDGGIGTSGAVAGNGGQGGGTSITLGAFSTGVSTILTFSSGSGGVGGNSNAAGTGGSGGTGGDLSVNWTSLNIGAGSLMNLKGGIGGNAGGSDTGTGGSGGTGGNLDMTLGAFTLNGGTTLDLTGGQGGNGGSVTTSGAGGNGGTGGSVSFSVGSFVLASGDYLNFSGGSGGTGGTGTTAGSTGTNGQAWVSIGNLQGQGSVFGTGSNCSLLVNQGSFAGTIGGTENLQKIGSGSLTLSAFNTYAGGTSILGGILDVDTGGTLGAGGAQVGSGALLDYIDSSAAINAVTVSGGATLQFQDQSSAGLATITLQSGGLALFTGAATGGIATFENSAGSTLDLSGSTSGGVSIGWLSGSGLVNMGSNNFGVGLVGASTTFSGAISGTGALDMEGGNFTLSSDNPYTGGTHIDSGILSVGSSQALGSGTVAVNGGALAIDPGSSPLTLKIGGNYSQGAGGALEVNVGGANMASSDFISVGGSSSLSGGLFLVAGSGLTAPIGTSTAILGSASNTGLFLGVGENLSGIRLLPVYSSNSVSLLSIIPSFQALGLTPNQVAIGADMDAVALDPRMDSFMASIGVLSNSRMQGTFSQLSPEDFAGLYQAGFEAAQARASLVEDRLSQLMVDVDNTVWMPGFSNSKSPWFAANISASDEVALSLQKTSPWGGFLSANGGFFNVSADANAAGYQVSSFGLTGAGLDYRLSRQASVGLLVGYGHTDVTLGTGGTATADGGELGLYGLFYSEGFYASGLAEGGTNNYGTQRQGYNGTANGKTEGQEFDGALEMGYQFKQDQVKLGPFGSAQYTNVGLNSFKETGSQAPLTLPNQSQDSFLTHLGVRADGQWQLAPKTFLNPSLELAWEHEYDSQGGTLVAGFGTGDSFTVSGPQVGQDGLLASVGVELTWLKSMSLSLRYQGELGRANLTSNQFVAGVKLGL